MELRDILNTKEKYIENIDFDENTIKEDIDEYEENKENWDDERIRVQFEDLIRYNYQVLISKYSLGLPVSEIIEDYKQGVYFMQKGWKAESGYIEMLWYLSIGIMIEIENSEFQKLVQLVERDALNDFLIDFLIQSKSEQYKKQTNQLLWEKPYLALQEVITLAKEDKQKATKRLQHYLKKEWYKGHSDCGWYNDHKSKWAVHSGYWSFESGAVVKILNLDDKILKDQKYYPYDLVHFNS